MPSPPRYERQFAQLPERRAIPMLAHGVWVLALALQCTFPEYETRAPLAVVAGAGGTVAGAQQSGGSETAGSDGGGGTSRAGEGGGGGQGGMPSCEGEQWPSDRCEAGCVRRFPAHCYDFSKSGDELAPDCGGSCQPCVVESCVVPTDCLSGVCGDGEASTCESPLLLLQDAHEKNDTVGSTAWSVTLQNVGQVGGRVFTLRQLQIRYYFKRNGAIEPILLRATQSILRRAGSTNSELKKTEWRVVRFPDSEDAAYDAYAQISFNDGGQLFPGDELVLYQQMLTADPSQSEFDQRDNYSFTREPGPSERLTVHYRGQLVWGLEPRPENPRACFAKGVNLNGPALTIDGNDWLGAGEAGVTSTGTDVMTSGPVWPAEKDETLSMLTSVSRLTAGQELNFPVDNGPYLLYLYAVSGTDLSASTIVVDGRSFVNSSKFRSQSLNGAAAWARLGPYSLDVSRGVVSVAVTSGAIDFGGFELWYPQ